VPNGYVPITSTGVPGIITSRRLSSRLHCSPQSYSHFASRNSMRAHAWLAG
jgi:hypothetical protein